MCKPNQAEKCEASHACRNEVKYHNKIVRDKATKVARIMCICAEHFTKITGAK